MTLETGASAMTARQVHVQDSLYKRVSYVAVYFHTACFETRHSSLPDYVASSYVRNYLVSSNEAEVLRYPLLNPRRLGPQSAFLCSF